MGNVFFRYNRCADIEIIEHPRRSESSSDDSIEFVDCLEFVEIDLNT